jgi:pimeloyl-ACP methyl ester carboxylesterase
MEQTTYKTKVKNKYNESLDVLVEGIETDKVLLFAHGLGTNKDEGLGLFKDMSQALSKDFRIIRFDFSAYGESEGKEEDSNLIKTAEDLGVMVDFMKSNYSGEYYLIAHSMGTYTTGKLNPNGFKKIILTSVPNDIPECSIERLSERIKSREEGILNYNSISTYPRTSGKVQKVGPT